MTNAKIKAPKITHTFAADHATVSLRGKTLTGVVVVAADGREMVSFATDGNPVVVGIGPKLAAKVAQYKSDMAAFAAAIDGLKKQAADFDRLQNEGATDGYNPYRNQIAAAFT